MLLMLLKMSFSGGILILLIIVLRSLAINKLPKKLFVLLWDIVLLRLLIPVDLPFRHGIASPVVKMAGDGIATLTTASSHLPQGKMGEFIPDLERAGNIVRIDWALLLWLAGAIILFAIFGVLYVRERQRLREALPISKEVEADLRLLAGLPNRIRLLVSDRISTPLAFGILSAKIILPKALKTTDTMQLKYVLTHEIIHIKRADNLWKNIMLLVLCIHWFHPLVWAMYVLFHRDIELSCDEKVISLFGENAKKEYAMALVYLAEKQCRPSLFSNGFGKNAIQERIVAIMNFKKATTLSIGCAVLLVGAATTVFAQNDLQFNMGNYISEDICTEGTVANANAVRIVANSEYFTEYEKYGLSYDSTKNYLMYEGNVVGYFKDETAANVYTRVLDDVGTVGILVSRDSEYHITGLEKVAIPQETGNILEGKNDMEPHNALACEQSGGDASELLMGYEKYGLSYASSNDSWQYSGMEVAGLIDDDKIYVNGYSDSKNAVFLQILGNKVEQISEKQFNKLLTERY